MKPSPIHFKISISIAILVLSLSTAFSQFEEKTFTVENVRKHVNWNLPVDEFTILGSTGITWLRISAALSGDWERSQGLLYDEVPIPGYTVVCPKIPPPPNPYGFDTWHTVGGLSIFMWGEGSVTIRVRRLNLDGPFAQEGQYMDVNNPDGTTNGLGTIIADPPSAGPGDNVNIRVTIPSRIRRHVTGVQLTLPEPTAHYRDRANRRVVNLPFNSSGVYSFLWTVPVNDYYLNLGSSQSIQVSYVAMANKPSENGQFRRLCLGTMTLNISGELSASIYIQDKEATGSNAIWSIYKDRYVHGHIRKGRGPFTTRWVINGEEIGNTPNYHELSRKRGYNNTAVLADASTITFEVTDANGNSAFRTVNVGIDTDMSLTMHLQGREIPEGGTAEWNETGGKIVIARIKKGKRPLKARWIINDGEFITEPEELISGSIAQLKDKEILNQATRVTVEVIDANGVQRTGTIFIGNPPEEEEDQPTTPTGPRPTPPPLTGDPSRGVHPDVEWNNRPWLDERVQQCTNEYLNRIVFTMANEYRRWENTGRSEGRQQPLFTRIDDWGRIFSPNMSAIVGVDGPWDNPTHFVWSEYNKTPYADERFGRTVEYYVKYECALLEPPGESIDDAIEDLNEGLDNGWNEDKTKQALEDLSDLMEMMRDLYQRFNNNYNKLINEVNDQRSAPQENDLIAFCLASAQGQYDEHTINLDTVNDLGAALIAQAPTNEDIEIYDIIRQLTEVETQSSDMERKLAEMKELLANYGGDIDEIMENGQQIAQSNVDPEFAQDGGINAEFMGDEQDNTGDGVADYVYGSPRKGNVLILVYDAGRLPDDIIEASLSNGEYLGRTLQGSYKFYDVTLDVGFTYTITLKAILAPDNDCTTGVIIWHNDIEVLNEKVRQVVGEETPFDFTIQ